MTRCVGEGGEVLYCYCRLGWVSVLARTWKSCCIGTPHNQAHWSHVSRTPFSLYHFCLNCFPFAIRFFQLSLTDFGTSNSLPINPLRFCLMSNMPYLLPTLPWYILHARLNLALFGSRFGRHVMCKRLIRNPQYVGRYISGDTLYFNNPRDVGSHQCQTVANCLGHCFLYHLLVLAAGPLHTYRYDGTIGSLNRIALTCR
ncbi:hypothetical protein V8C26DRAFT_190513 [Trichoderma gracile]